MIKKIFKEKLMNKNYNDGKKEYIFKQYILHQTQ